MGKALLVSIDVAAGAELVRALDSAKLNVKVALWAYLSEYEDWRFVLASPRLDAVRLQDAYGMVHDALEASGITYENTPTLFIMNMADRFIRDLRRIFGKTKSVEGMRLGFQAMGDRFIEDAYVYRIT